MKNYLATAKEMSYGQQAETLADLVHWIETTNTATPAEVDGKPALEFTAFYSPIIPLAVVTGSDVDGQWVVTAEAEPGQTISEDSLLAYEVATLRRLRRNAAAREGAAK